MDDPATAWAADVVAGRIISGDLMRRACERHLRDIAEASARGLYWRPEKAAHALGFFPSVLSVTAGAMVGEPFNLPSWTSFAVGSLFGWVRESGRRRYRHAWFELGKGMIKALALDTPIPTPTGWTTMGSLSPGATVLDDLGQPCQVIATTPVAVDQDCYEVEFDDGAKIVADAGHLWLTEMRSYSPKRGGALRGVRKSEWGTWRIGLRTTAEIAGTLRYRNGKYQSANHSVALSAPLCLPPHNLSIPPYTLGAWLGDGDSDSARITVAVDDWDIVRNIEAEGVQTTEQTRHAPHIARVALRGRVGRWHRRGIAATVLAAALSAESITAPELSKAATGCSDDKARAFIRNGGFFEQVSPCRGIGNGGGTIAGAWRLREDRRAEALVLVATWEEAPISVRLRNAGLIGNKHIPAEYLRGSIEQRVALLRGLMDTDGTINSSGGCRYDTTNSALADGVAELLRTLGIKAFIAPGKAMLNGKYVGPKWSVSFDPPHDFPVFALKRKLERQTKRHNRRRLAGDRRIVNCRRVPSVPVKCISVDSPSRMYLAGREMVPTHNSPTMGALGIYIMGYCGIARSEVYAIAKDRNQANVLFQDAVAMCQAPIPGTDGETLESRGEVVIRGTGQMSWLVEHPHSGSQFKPLAGDEKVSGPRPSLVVADEIHEWRTGGPIETWQASLAKMPGDAMMILGTNTPAADQLVGTEYSEIYQRILRGEVQDDTAFALIARTDPTDDPMHDETCWPKSLPCLGLTFPIENVRGEVNAAEHRMAKSLAVKRLYFGIPVGTSEYWIDLDAWEGVQGKVDPEAMRGSPCYLALDLSQKNDLTALGIGWMVDGKLHATVRYWKPLDGIADAERRDGGATYRQWVAEGLLIGVPGRAIEYEFVAAEVEHWCSEHNPELMTFDPAHSSEFRKACDRISFETWIWEPDAYQSSGLKMVIHGQGAQGMHSTKALWMPRSLQQLEDMILTDNIVIDESPITKYCAGNAAVRADARNNRFLEKKRQRGVIDGLTVLAMLAGAVTMGAGETDTIYSDGRELRFA